MCSSDLDVAESCNNLAQLYQAQGKLDEAAPLFLRALIAGVTARCTCQKGVTFIRSSGMARGSRP